ncbi:MAG TPA: hypothetical protein VFU50_20400 [Terriglobales bacterium]|nr:hypothetical protein [Terriglobales bacterium]
MPRGHGNVWYYVLHRDGLSKIIDLKKFSTYDEARKARRRYWRG